MLCVGQNLITRRTGNFQYPAFWFLDLGLWAPFVDPHIHFKPSLVQLFQCQETPDYSSYVADYLWSTFNLHSLKLSLYIRTNSLLWEEKKRWNSFVTTMSRLLVCWIESTEVMTISVVTGGVIRHASSSVGEEFAELFCCLICCFSEAERWWTETVWWDILVSWSQLIGRRYHYESTILQVVEQNLCRIGVNTTWKKVDSDRGSRHGWRKTRREQCNAPWHIP